MNQAILPFDELVQIQTPVNQHKHTQPPSSLPESLSPERCAFCRPESCLSQNRLWGCQGFCEHSCNPATCDYVCPRRPVDFVHRWREVDGWPARTDRTLCGSPSSSWPRYLPLIQHGSRFGHLFDATKVAIPTFRALATTRKKQLNAIELRRRFRLRDDADLIAISVAQDPPLERYWRYRDGHDLPKQMAEWNLSALTVPNFSFFTDAPPWHTLWNFHRMLKVAEEFSLQGIPIVPHVNCLDDNHRLAWAAILRDQPHLKFVAKEFQTGAKKHNVANQAFSDLCRLQDEVGRPLHPIVIGAARLWNRMRQHFENFTVVDSKPFMLTINRQEILDAPDGIVRSKPHPLPQVALLDALWRLNLSRYGESLKGKESPKSHPISHIDDAEFQRAFQ